MPKHDRDHDGEKPSKPNGPGPKERELAIELTLALLHAGDFTGKSVDELTGATADIYTKMLALVAPARPTGP